jgi:hypothetical protein
MCSSGIVTLLVLIMLVGLSPGVLAQSDESVTCTGKLMDIQSDETVQRWRKMPCKRNLPEGREYLFDPHNNLCGSRGLNRQVGSGHKPRRRIRPRLIADQELGRIVRYLSRSTYRQRLSSICRCFDFGPAQLPCHWPLLVFCWRAQVSRVANWRGCYPLIARTWRAGFPSSSGRAFALHSITSSARATSVAGTSSPSALAVLILMTKSNFVGCSIGRSAGLAPLIILST